MNIKALIFDLDGTAIPNHPDGMPSEKVVEIVQKAKEKVFVSVATGRPFWMCQNILESLQIDNECILNGGTHLFNPVTKSYAWKQEMDEIMVQQIMAVLSQYDYLMGCEKDNALKPTPGSKYHAPETVGLIAMLGIDEADFSVIQENIKKISGVVSHKLNSWTKGKFDLHISHELATKRHALQALLARNNLQSDTTMVVGDGGNDLPLFELAGWKVAMGNANEELKAQADWIAPSVDEDGLAVAIEKFILEEK